MLSKYTGTKREYIWVKVVPLPGGLSASPLNPTIISYLGSSSALTSTSSNFNSFCTCSTSYEKRGIACQITISPFYTLCERFCHPRMVANPPKFWWVSGHHVTACHAIWKVFWSNREVGGRERWRKEVMKSVFSENQCIPANSGEYHSLLSLIEVLVQLTLLGMDPSSLSYKLKAASMAPRPGPSP